MLRVSDLVVELEHVPRRWLLVAVNGEHLLTCADAAEHRWSLMVCGDSAGEFLANESRPAASRQLSDRASIGNEVRP